MDCKPLLMLPNTLQEEMPLQKDQTLSSLQLPDNQQTSLAQIPRSNLLHLFSVTIRQRECPSKPTLATNEKCKKKIFFNHFI